MKGIHKFAMLGALGIAGPFFSQESRAADAAQPADSDALTTIIVTAEKREEKLKDVPMSITALGGGSLDNLQYRSFSDYAAMVPGLSLTSAQPGYTNLTLRGQNAGGVGSTVAVYLDESPFGSSSALLNGSILSGDFDTWDLQRVEVLRGPQGTLYGANSEGGLLKFVTAPPVLGSFSGAAEVTGEITGGTAGGEIRGVVNLPLGDKMALRVGGFTQDSPGFIDDPSRNKEDINGGHKYGGRVSLLAQPIDSLTIRLTGSSQESRYAGTPQVDIDPVTLNPTVGELKQERIIGQPSTFQYKNYNATINWDAGPFSILSTTSYGILNSDAITDDTNAQLAPGLTLQDFAALLLGLPNTGGYLDNLVDLKKFTQEVRISSPTTNFIEWQVGAYYTHELGHLFQHVNLMSLPSGAPITALPPLQFATLDSIYKETSGFGNVTVHIIPQFDIQAGGRYSKNEQVASENISGILANPPQVFSTPSSGNVWTYSVAPRWHINTDNMLYFRWATGYRPGGPNALPPVAPPDVPRQYGADKTNNLELGLKSTLLNGLLSIDASVFHVDWTNIQLLEIVDNNGINGNGGKAKSQGFEWTIGYVPVHGLTVQWTGAYTDAKLTTDAPAVSGVSGDRLPYAPKWGTSLDGEYTAAAFADYRYFVGATWSYVGARSTDFGSDVTQLLQVQLPSYNTYGARVGLDNDRWRWTLYGKNLSNSRGITAYGSSGAPGLNGEVAVTQPLTVGLTLSTKF